MTPRTTLRGLTLIELLIVIVILGVLSTLATVSYRKFKTQAHVTEANAVMNSMRLAEVQYFRDSGGSFLDTSNSSLDTSWCPSGTPGNKKLGWNPECGSTATGTAGRGKWKQLPVKVDGPVYFQYVAVAGPVSGDNNRSSLSAAGSFAGMANINGVTQNLANAPAGPFFLIAGQADPLGKGSITTKALTHSATQSVALQENY